MSSFPRTGRQLPKTVDDGTPWPPALAGNTPQRAMPPPGALPYAPGGPEERIPRPLVDRHAARFGFAPSGRERFANGVPYDYHQMYRSQWALDRADDANHAGQWIPDIKSLASKLYAAAGVNCQMKAYSDGMHSTSGPAYDAFLGRVQEAFNEIARIHVLLQSKGI